MKKLLLTLLALLLLTGCGNNEETHPTETTEPAPTVLYDPDSPMEAETGGAVRAYPLMEALYEDAIPGKMEIIPMGSKLLLYDGEGALSVLSGDLCEIAATAQLAEDRWLFMEATAQGAFYYQEDTREVVMLNPQLQEMDRLRLPEDMESFALSAQERTVYYTLPGELRALDMQTGISRLIRSHSYASASIMEVHFDGELLKCIFTDEQNEDTTEYISSQTGQTLYTQEIGLWTGSDAYAVRRYDGSVEQRIVGRRGGEAKLLTIQAEQLVNAMAMDGVLGYTVDTEGMQLALYDVESGKCTSLVVLDGIRELLSIAVTEKYVWILAEDKDYYHEPAIYRWDVSKTTVNEDVVYTDTLYTAENPDTEGLAACQERVDAMNKQYGVRIRIWQDAVAQPGEYTLVPEYQVQTINEMLDSLEPALALFPAGFLQKTVESGWICINLVRAETPRDFGYVQYWAEGDCHIAIAGTDTVGDSFLSLVGYAIDSHVLGNSRDYDDWNALNPEGFQYTDDETVLLEQNYRGTYLMPEDSAFIGEQSLYSPTDERTRLFYHAIRTDANVFTNDARQQKLKRMCEGIREAYGLEKSDETYLWEQYLTLELDYNNIR